MATFVEFFDNEQSCLAARLGEDALCEDLGTVWGGLPGEWTPSQWKALMIYGFIKRSLGGTSMDVTLTPTNDPCGPFFPDKNIDLCFSHSDLMLSMGIDAAINLTCNATVGAVSELMHSVVEKKKEWFPYVAHIQQFCEVDATLNVYIISFITFLGFMVVGFMVLCGGKRKYGPR
mgnify:CR=1 FL=1